MKLTNAIIGKIAILFVLTCVWVLGLCMCESLVENGKYVIGFSLVVVPMCIISWMFSSGRCNDVIAWIDKFEK